MEYIKKWTIGGPIVFVVLIDHILVDTGKKDNVSVFQNIKNIDIAQKNCENDHFGRHPVNPDFNPLEQILAKFHKYYFKT